MFLHILPMGVILLKFKTRPLITLTGNIFLLRSNLPLLELLREHYLCRIVYEEVNLFSAFFSVISAETFCWTAFLQLILLRVLWKQSKKVLPWEILNDESFKKEVEEGVQMMSFVDVFLCRFWMFFSCVIQKGNAINPTHFGKEIQLYW